MTTRLRRLLVTEWRYTYLSARCEYTRRASARQFAHEFGKGLLQLHRP